MADFIIRYCKKIKSSNGREREFLMERFRGLFMLLSGVFLIAVLGVSLLIIASDNPSIPPDLKVGAILTLLVFFGVLVFTLYYRIILKAPFSKFVDESESVDKKEFFDVAEKMAKESAKTKKEDERKENERRVGERRKKQIEIQGEDRRIRDRRTIRWEFVPEEMERLNCIKTPLLTSSEIRFFTALRQVFTSSNEGDAYSIIIKPKIREFVEKEDPINPYGSELMETFHSLHIDFVIMDNKTGHVCMAIELDDSSHDFETRKEKALRASDYRRIEEAEKRDKVKDDIMRILGIPFWRCEFHSSGENGEKDIMHVTGYRFIREGLKRHGIAMTYNPEKAVGAK